MMDVMDVLENIYLAKGCNCMGKVIVAVIATILIGYIGFIIGSVLNLEGYLGIVFSIATIGGFILHSIENKK